MTETAEEYVKRVVEENKSFYGTPEKMIEEYTGLIKNLPNMGLSKDKQWELLTAVSEAWHVVLWVDEEKKAKRLINTISSFIKESVVA